MRTWRMIGVAAGVLALTGAAAQAELMYATDGSNLVLFDSLGTPAVTTRPLTGLQPGETLVGIDVRPANQQLYGVGSTGRLYQFPPGSGSAFPIGAAGAFALNGTAFGTDFNPVPDRIRQVSNTEQNLRLNPNDGSLTATDTALNPPGNVVAVAYANNFPGAATTTLYAIDSAAGTLGIVSNPNGGGPITTVGSLGLGTNLNENIGFDISGLTGNAFASITVGGQSRLYRIDLSTGAATLQGVIGSGTTPYLGLAAATAPEPAGLGLLAAGAVTALCRRRRTVRLRR